MTSYPQWSNRVFFLDLLDMPHQLLLQRGNGPASTAPTSQVLPPIRTCTAVFRNCSLEA